MAQQLFNPVINMAIDDPNEWAWFHPFTAPETSEYLRRALGHLKSTQRPQTLWQPALDMYETDRVLWVVVALPGVAPNSINLLVRSGILIINGERRFPTEFRHAMVHRMEIPHGHFERRLELPMGSYELSDHAFEDGCLIMQLNKLL